MPKNLLIMFKSFIMRLNCIQRRKFNKNQHCHYSLGLIYTKSMFANWCTNYASKLEIANKYKRPTKIVKILLQKVYVSYLFLDFTMQYT